MNTPKMHDLANLLSEAEGHLRDEKGLEHIGSIRSWVENGDVSAVSLARFISSLLRLDSIDLDPEEAVLLTRIAQDITDTVDEIQEVCMGDVNEAVVEAA